MKCQILFSGKNINLSSAESTHSMVSDEKNKPTGCIYICTVITL